MKRLLAALLVLTLLGGLGLTAYADNTGKTPDLSGWTDLVQIETCRGCILGLRADGTVLRWGGEEYGLGAVDRWTGIGQILFSYAYGQDPAVFGLKKDGTVVTTSAADCSAWHDITDIVSGSGFWVAGLVADGSVVVTKKGALCEYDGWEKGWLDVSGWKGVVALEPLAGWTVTNGLAGICADGSVRVTATADYSYAEDWRDIAAVCDTLDALYGLRKDGSLALPPRAEDMQGEVLTAPIRSWTAIAALTAGHQDDLFAVRQDGRVETSSSAFEYPFADAAGSWEKIRSLYADYDLLIGVRTDGRLAFCGGRELPELASWRGIEDVRIGGDGDTTWVIGLRTDGTAVLAEAANWY